MGEKKRIVIGHDHPAHGKAIIPGRYGFSEKWILVKLHGILV